MSEAVCGTMSKSFMHSALQFALLASIFVAFYGGVFRFALLNVTPLTRVVLRSTLFRQRTIAELESVIRVNFGVLLQLAFCLVLMGVTGIAAADLYSLKFDPILILYGMALGIGEAGLATLLAYIVVQLGLLLFPRRTPRSSEEWISLARSGWVRVFSQAAGASPRLAIILTLLYIMVEETVFRGVVLLLLQDWHPYAAVAGSVVLFASVQVFRMPSWQSAVFPVIGAMVVGLIHAALFMAVPNLLPIVIAHWVFFLIVTV
jgi:hypothetical protein